MTGPFNNYDGDPMKNQDPRGPLLLLNPVGWRKRYRTWAIGVVGRLYFMVSMTYLFWYFVYFADGMRYMGWEIFTERTVNYPRNTIVFYVLLGQFLSFYYFIITRRPVPAIYEQGVQLPHGSFIPFSSIYAIYRVREGFPRKKDVITLQPISVEGPDPEDPLMLWVVPFEVIGYDGEELIRERINNFKLDYDPITEPPSLFIYGPMDDRLQMRSDD